MPTVNKTISGDYITSNGTISYVGGSTDYTNLTDSDDASYAQYTGAGSWALWPLVDMPSDLETVTAVTINLREGQGSGKGDWGDLDSVQIFKSDLSTPLTSSVTATDTTTPTTFNLTPATIHFTDKASWDGAYIKVLQDLGASIGIRVYKLDVDITYTATLLCRFNVISGENLKILGAGTMASYDEVKLEDIVHDFFATYNPTTGANKDADSTPTIAVYEEGNSTAMTVTSSVTNVTTGKYRWQINVAAADGFEAGKYYSVWLTATVTGSDTVTQSVPVMSFKATARVVDDLATQTSVDTIDDLLDTEIAAIYALLDTEIAALTANLVIVSDGVGYLTAALIGAISDAGTAGETYVITFGGSTYTLDYAGLDSTGNRGATTRTKT